MLAMNDQQLQMMKNPQLMLNPSQMLHMINQNQNHPHPLMNHSTQMMNQNQNQSVLMNQNQPVVLINHQSQVGMNRSYGGLWVHHQQQQQVANPNSDPMKYPAPFKRKFGVSQSSLSTSGRSNNWKGKKGIRLHKDGRRNEQQKPKSLAKFGLMNNTCVPVGTHQELQYQNRAKARRFYPKKNSSTNRFAPYAPRNTTSFIIRSKKSGGIASLVSPYPGTPAVLPTPKFSPSREVLGDMAKEQWGVDGYGSMKGLIRLRSPGKADDADEDEDTGTSESDVEEHVEVERRLDHDLSRFEMIYPACEVEYNNLLENRVDDQDTHIAQLEEENIVLKQRLFLMERELDDLRSRLQHLDGHNPEMDDLNEEVVENGSDNESECCVIGNSYCRSRQTNNEVYIDVSSRANAGGGAAADDDSVKKNNEEIGDACMTEPGIASPKEEIPDVDASKDGEEEIGCHAKSSSNHALL